MSQGKRFEAKVLEEFRKTFRQARSLETLPTGHFSQRLRHQTTAEITATENIRRALIKTLAPYLKPHRRGSKLLTGKLSEGCKSCSKGEWGCLYVHTRCNANCFFCHRPDSGVSLNCDGLSFKSATEFVDYVQKNRFTGVSFSGGEPLLDMPAVCKLTEALRKRLGDKLYIWLYTNGILADSQNLHRLRSAGINEVRFDIAANGYDIEPVKRAAEILPVVTVEIPMIPEHLDKLSRLLPKLEAAGVKHLNIHQLRATELNFKALSKRGYTFLRKHQSGFAVIESELAALQLLRHARKIKSKISINYCSSQYKESIQDSAFRKRCLRGQSIPKTFQVTQAAYLRQVKAFSRSNAAGQIVDPRKIGVLPKLGTKFTVTYFSMVFSGGSGRSPILPVANFRLDQEMADIFSRYFARKKNHVDWDEVMRQLKRRPNGHELAAQLMSISAFEIIDNSLSPLL